MCDTSETTMLLDPTCQCGNSGDEQQWTAHTKKGNIGWTFSGMYCMYLVVFGSVLVVAEALQSTPVNEVYVEAFSCFLYITGILYMAYMCVFFAVCKLKCETAHTGSLYLKFGAVIFAMGSIIGDGIRLGAYFDPYPHCELGNISLALAPSIRIVFVLGELGYLLTKSGMCINKQKGLVKMGTMHLVACNLCTWLRVLATETTEALKKHRFVSLQNISFNGSYGDSIDRFFTTNRSSAGSVPPNISCSYAKAGHLAEVLEKASAFLYPCTVEFSLIAAGILYTHWSNVGKDRGNVTTQSEDRTGRESDHQQEQSGNSKIYINCKSSLVGFSFGILVITLTVVIMIVFATSIESDARSETAVTSYQCVRLFLYVLATALLPMTMWSLREHVYRESDVLNLDCNLLFIALGGGYLLATFTLFAGILITKSQNHPIYTYTPDVPGLTIATAVLQIFQSTIQTMCLVDGLRRLPPSGYDSDKLHHRRHIRHCVVFLMLTNISLWLMNTFEVKMPRTDPVTMSFYLHGPWIVILHISCPLVIFFRFHSTACFFDIWTHAFYKNEH